MRPLRAVPPRPRPGRRRRSERGSALVEAAIVLPVVMTLFLGVIEFGFVWKDKLAVSNAVRSAARIGSADGTSGAADYDILQQIKSATSGLSVVKIIVWDAYTYPTFASLDTTNCKTTAPPTFPTPAGVANVCNVYGPSALAAGVTSASFNCASNSASPDYNWCPNNTTGVGTHGPRIDSRTGNVVNNVAQGPDYVGVYVQISHPFVTKIMGASTTLSDSTVLRIEPTN